MIAEAPPQVATTSAFAPLALKSSDASAGHGLTSVPKLSVWAGTEPPGAGLLPNCAAPHSIELALTPSATA